MIPSEVRREVAVPKSLNFMTFFVPKVTWPVGKSSARRHKMPRPLIDLKGVWRVCRGGTRPPKRLAQAGGDAQNADVFGRLSAPGQLQHAR